LSGASDNVYLSEIIVQKFVYDERMVRVVSVMEYLVSDPSPVLSGSLTENDASSALQ
jgi:hypothetical protein